MTTDTGNPNPAANPATNPNPSPGGDWRASFGAENAKALESFKEPGDFFKQYQTVSGELDTLKKSTHAFDWRKEISGGDEAAAKVFERFATMADAGKAYREAVAKIRSGELAKPLPKDATAEQVAEWRKGNGIPEKPAGYWEGQLPQGLVIGAEDKPFFDSYSDVFHKHNLTPAAVHDIAQHYYKMQGDQIKVQEEADAKAKPALEGELKKLWGTDFGQNANIYSNFMASLPKEVSEVLGSARDVEGNFILYRPEVVAWLTAQAREINPAGHIVPGSAGEGGLQSIQSEIDTIESFMKTNRAAYNKDEKKQERLRQLYDARIKLQQRGRAA